MNRDAHLQQHLELCKRIFKRLQAEGKFPWSDSPNSEDVVDSDSPENDA